MLHVCKSVVVVVVVVVDTRPCMPCNSHEPCKTTSLLHPSLYSMLYNDKVCVSLFEMCISV
jgi:hypothetical protein